MIQSIQSQSSKFYQEIEKKDKTKVIWITVTDQDLKQKILNSYSDDDTRSILQNAMDQPLAMSDFSRTCNIPLTTCYRKLETLVQSGLLTKDNSSTKLRKDVIRYKTTFKNLKIKIRNGKPTVQVPVDSVQQNGIDLLRNESQKRKYLKRTYRSELCVMMEILNIVFNCGKEGALISRIVRVSNVSYPVAMEKCEKLWVGGFLDFVNVERNKIFTITDKGIALIKGYDAFRDLSVDLNVRF